jgi:hypothetical protein
VSRGDRTDGGAREDTAGEGLLERTDGALRWPFDQTQGHAAPRGVSPTRTLVLARVAAPRRQAASPVEARGGEPAVAVHAPMRAILTLARSEVGDALPPPDDGVPRARPRRAYAGEGSLHVGAEVTSEVPRPWGDAAREPLGPGALHAARTVVSGGPEQGPAALTPAGNRPVWIARVLRWTRALLTGLFHRSP